MAGSQNAATIFKVWCGRGDLNPHAFRRHPLKMVCLPVPPLPLDCQQPKTSRNTEGISGAAGHCILSILHDSRGRLASLCYPFRIFHPFIAGFRSAGQCGCQGKGSSRVEERICNII